MTSCCGGYGRLQWLWWLVMGQLRLGLKSPALAWLEAAWAWKNHKPGQKPKVGLGLAWPWPGPVSL